MVFAAVWLGVQAALVMTAARRSDGAFGFCIARESTSLKLALFREVDGPDGPTRIHVDDGVWPSRGPDGRVHRQSWYDRVPIPRWIFDRETTAPDGLAAERERLQRELDDVAAHLSLEDDAETRRLLLEVSARRNGREPVTLQLWSRPRSVREGER
jgi:hypothetical protein